MSINMRNFDLNLLRMFLEVYETGSVSRAGAKLGLSQPASSNALARLRQSFDDPLFIRAKTGMIPTQLAERMAPDIQRHFQGLSRALTQEQSFVLSTTTQTYRLSLSGLGESIFLPKLASRVMAAAPGIRLFNVSSPFDSLSSALEVGDADVAIGIFNIEGRGLKSKTLFHETYSAVVGSGFVAPKFPILSLKPFKIIISAPSATYANNISKTIDHGGLNDNIIMRLKHFGALPELLRTLDVVAIVPTQLADDLVVYGQAEVLPYSFALPPSKVKMIWHEITEHEEAHIWLRAQIFELFFRRN